MKFDYILDVSVKLLTQFEIVVKYQLSISPIPPNLIVLVCTVTVGVCFSVIGYDLYLFKVIYYHNRLFRIRIYLPRHLVPTAWSTTCVNVWCIFTPVPTPPDCIPPATTPTFYVTCYHLHIFFSNSKKNRTLRTISCTYLNTLHYTK